MVHDITKALLGSVPHSDKVITCEDADPASFPAGTVVRGKSDGGLQIAAGSGATRIGVSLGPDLSSVTKTAVCRKGSYIPMLLTPIAAFKTIGNLTFTLNDDSIASDVVTVALIDDESDASAAIETAAETPNDVIIHIQGGVTTATTIKNAIEADAATNALLSVEIEAGSESVGQAAAAETGLDGQDDVAAIGEVVQVNATTGKGVVSGDTTGAVYVSGRLTGVYPDGSTAACAYINLKGGF